MPQSRPGCLGAAEKTVSSDAQARLKLSGKLQLLQTALLILVRVMSSLHPSNRTAGGRPHFNRRLVVCVQDRSVKETSQEEYNALVHLGERIRSAVELYRAQTVRLESGRPQAADLAVA